MKIYSKDLGWAGGRVFIANDREDAIRIMKTLNPRWWSEEENKTFVRHESVRRFYASVQTLKTVEPIPNTSLYVCHFVNDDRQVVTNSSEFTVGQKVAFFPTEVTYNGVVIKLRRLQKFWSHGIIEPFDTELFGAIPARWDTITIETPYTDDDYLNEWTEHEVKSGLSLYFSGDW